MSLESDIAETFRRNEWTWNTTRGMILPNEEDVLAVLDEAAKTLYNEPVGTQLEVGRLIIKKKHHGHDVYLFAGPYE